MRTNQASNNTTISLSLVLLSVLASIGLILFGDMSTGALFPVGYLIVAAISSTFKNRRYSSPRVVA
ncbi:hypothetical protein [Nitrosomonas sp. Is37]|uniref:hypothetical protein n=1 Tax=Nitrosomonas sp. Is37 TaxID=3080535 RepID=UPI00294AA14C|nr:hypothetical protein [Nitrosomonas sp. Is37]MDV6345569.1 hypothetical protein [Nitrosomonas sp. Is37]